MKNDLHIYNCDLIRKSEKLTFKKQKSFEVMKIAAKACCDYIINQNFNFKNILILCGPGNNGGDGALIAKYLFKKDFFVNVHYPFGSPKNKDLMKVFSYLENKKLFVKNIKFNKYDLLIDAMFGIGNIRRLNKKDIYFFKKINNKKLKIFSIDMPSGIDTDSGQIKDISIKANTTLTFHRYKPGQFLLPGKEFVGKIILLDIGLKNLDKQCNLLLNIPKKISKPKLSENKFMRGICGIIAGENLIGASKLSFLSASKSALRSGSGLIKIFVKEGYQNYFKKHILEEMIITYKNINNLFSLILNEKCQTMIYGCGIENNLNNLKILKILIKENIKLVLDAGVFTMIMNNKKDIFKLLKLRNAETVMTPHHGEMKRIFATTDNKINDSITLAKKTNSVVVYKGNDTVISSPNGKSYINFNSSAYLATAGSGDVLAGIIGAFLSQGVSAAESAKIGCFIHSKCALNLGEGLIASDLINEIPKVLKEL